MELDVKPKVFNNQVKDTSILKDRCIHINLYKNPPFGLITLEECEDLFRQRMEALTIIEKADISESKKSVIANSLREIKSYVYKTNCIITRFNDVQQRKLDHYSHMLARLYCIYQPNLWDWFKSCEKKLLYYRLRDQSSSLTASQIEFILKGFNFNFERVVGDELNELDKEGLISWSMRDNAQDLDIFKVKFTNALRFVAKRSVSLKGGYAFLTKYEMMTVICDTYEKHLDHELMFARQHLNMELMQTQRLLESLSLVYLDYQDKIEEDRRKNKRDQEGDKYSSYRIDIENLVDIVKNHYPPCMRYMHESLLEDHHLRHQGRLQYGAFLRSGGVDMESAIEFWRREFTKKIPNEKFERDYKYNIRHLYGREGHKKSLSCFSCDKIINDNAPGPVDKHGCPFKNFDDTHLKKMLTNHGLQDVDIESLLLMRADKEYKNVCSHYFKYLKGDFPSEPIKNPSHFYYESVRKSMNQNDEAMQIESDPIEQMVE